MERLVGKKIKDDKTQEKTMATLQKLSTDLYATAEERQKRVETINKELRMFGEQMKVMRDGPGKDAIKQKALRLLAQRRRLEQQVTSLREQAFNMDQAGFGLSTSIGAQESVSSAKEALKAMRKVLKKTNLGEVDEVHDELEELMEMGDEVNEALGRTYNTPVVDEDELRVALEELADGLDEDSFLEEAAAAVAAPNPPPPRPLEPGGAAPTEESTLQGINLPRVPDDPL